MKLSVREKSTGVSNIAFKHSDMDDNLSAVMYGGCVAIVPGAARPANYGKEYVVAYISPAKGKACRHLLGCKAAKR